MVGAPSTAGAMAKWWAKFVPARGLVQRTLSPMEHSILKTLVQNAPQKITKRVTGSLTDWAPPVALGIFTVWWADKTFHAEGLKHRS